MKFSEKLQKLRKENGMSQEDLADKLDVSRQSVSKWESGQTYPEMDKLLTMCKIFNITLDDLTNDEVNYNDVKPKNTKSFSNIIDDIIYIIDKTYNMFKNMTSKERGKCIGELIILFIILLLLKIPFVYIRDLGDSAINAIFNYRYFIFAGIWDFMINILYLILFIFTYVYIYKTYYLDKYKPGNVQENKEVKEKDENIVDNNEVKKEESKPKEVIIKEKRGIGTSLFTTMGTLASFLLKGFLMFMCIPFVLSFISLFLAFILMIVLIFKGIFYFGFLITILAGILLNYVLLKLLITFIFSEKLNFKVLFTSFIVGISLLGIGFGVSIIDIAYTEILNELLENKIPLTTRIEEYDMIDNLVINDHYWYYTKIDFVEDNSLTDIVKLEISYYKDVNHVEVFKSESNDFTYINTYSESKWNKKILDLILDNLKDKKIYEYDKLYNYSIKVYTSKTNIDKIRDNYKKYYDRENIEYNQSFIIENDSLRADIDLLNTQIYELTSKIDELENENETLKNKIDEYKNTLNLLD